MTSDEFVETLDDWTMRGGEFPSDKFDHHYLTTVEEAEAVVRALANGDLMYCKSQLRSPNLFRVAALVQSTYTPAVEKVFRRHALPHLNEIIAQGLSEDYSSVDQEGGDARATYTLKCRADTYFFVLKVASYYGDKLDHRLLIKAARDSYFSRSWVWSAIFDYTGRNNPKAVKILEALRSPLPNQFCRIGYLDFANTLAFDQRISTHPFDTDDGCEFLLSKFELVDTGYDSYAVSATAAAPFLSEARRERVLDAARSHPRKIVFSEVPWAEARANYPGSVEFLRAAALEPQTATRASRYLKAIGIDVPIPANVEVHRALQEASDWLRNEQDFFGLAPDHVFIVDQRILRWPPSGIEQPAWLIGFRHEQPNDMGVDILEGHAVIVGDSITRYWAEEGIRLADAYACILRYDHPAKDNYGEKIRDDVFCSDLLRTFNPELGP